MSNVYDSQGDLVNAPGPGCGRYTDANATTIDWFATHATKIPATLPLNSGVELKVVEAKTAGVTSDSLPQTAVTE